MYEKNGKKFLLSNMSKTKSGKLTFGFSENKSDTIGSESYDMMTLMKSILINRKKIKVQIVSEKELDKITA